MKTITIFLLTTSFMFVKMERMSSYEWIEIINDNFLIYTGYNTGYTGDAALEAEKCKKWKSAATPLLQRADKHLKNELPDITNDLDIDLIKYDSSYLLVREADKLSFQKYTKKETETCRYRMRFFGVKFSNSKKINDRLPPIEPNSILLSRIDIELAFKKLPKKSTLGELKIRLTECLKRIK